MNNEQGGDPGLVSFTELVLGFSDLDTKVGDETTGHFWADQLKIDFPMEMDVFEAKDGRTLIRSAPPLYHFETSFKTITHRLKMTIVAQDEPEK